LFHPAEIAHPPRFYLSPALGDEVIVLVVAHAGRCRSWIVPGYHINYSVRLQQFCRRGKLGPIWGYMRNLRGRGRGRGVGSAGGDRRKVGEG
ncbi:MAG TPA: hypothetical protein VGB21_04325, partial [Candidatus Methylomirabilis sp.]